MNLMLEQKHRILQLLSRLEGGEHLADYAVILQTAPTEVVHKLMEYLAESDNPFDIYFQELLRADKGGVVTSTLTEEEALDILLEGPPPGEDEDEDEDFPGDAFLYIEDLEEEDGDPLEGLEDANEEVTQEKVPHIATNHAVSLAGAQEEDR